jgi:hypothetical protein
MLRASLQRAGLRALAAGAVLLGACGEEAVGPEAADVLFTPRASPAATGRSAGVVGPEAGERRLEGLQELAVLNACLEARGAPVAERSRVLGARFAALGLSLSTYAEAIERLARDAAFQTAVEAGAQSCATAEPASAAASDLAAPAPAASADRVAPAPEASAAAAASPTPTPSASSGLPAPAPSASSGLAALAPSAPSGLAALAPSAPAPAATDATALPQGAASASADPAAQTAASKTGKPDGAISGTWTGAIRGELTGAMRLVLAEGSVEVATLTVGDATARLLGRLAGPRELSFGGRLPGGDAIRIQLRLERDLRRAEGTWDAVIDGRARRGQVTLTR